MALNRKHQSVYNIIGIAKYRNTNEDNTMKTFEDKLYKSGRTYLRITTINYLLFCGFFYLKNNKIGFKLTP